MFTEKNISANRLYFLIGVVLAFAIALGIFFLTRKWEIGLISFFIIWLGTYAFTRFAFERFINRKIKLIYKLINQTKATKKEEMYYKYVLPPKNIDEVRVDVEAWMINRNQEIELLRQNELYRKEFLQNLAHEFKTPIFAIQGYVETLLEGAMEDPAIRGKFLENTSKNADRLVSLISDLDEITRLESGEYKMNKGKFVIQDLIRETFETLSIKLQKKQMTAGIKKGCETPVAVFADKEKIRQVLMNLVDNATKYGKVNGHITASVYVTDDEHAVIEISDDGIGIDEEHIVRVFERFYRTDAARSRDKGGTGLGLAICKHIVEAHGQSVHARSTPEVGTTIGFTLQLALS